jgi:hypothetical protein
LDKRGAERAEREQQHGSIEFHRVFASGKRITNGRSQRKSQISD